MVVHFVLFVVHLHQFVVCFERHGGTVAHLPLQLKRRIGQHGFGPGGQSPARQSDAVDRSCFSIRFLFKSGGCSNKFLFPQVTNVG